MSSDVRKMGTEVRYLTRNNPRVPFGSLGRVDGGQSYNFMGDKFLAAEVLAVTFKTKDDFERIVCFEHELCTAAHITTGLIGVDENGESYDYTTGGYPKNPPQGLIEEAKKIVREGREVLNKVEEYLGLKL